MRITFSIIAFSLFVFASVFGQSHAALRKMKPSEKYENIHVKKLESDARTSSFLIWIKKGVKLHKHEFHSEHVFIIKGKGMMRLGKRKFAVKKGDMIFIPEGMPHSVMVNGGTMMVLSVQSPEFKGKDRIFLN